MSAGRVSERSSLAGSRAAWAVEPSAYVAAAPAGEDRVVPA
ncbi:hypothetical protein [Nonomuraea polychroma]|nr:hypothetical protein [Nonomuraea polychroma]